VSEFRKRVLEPALIPLVAFAFIGALAYAASRILLAVTTEGSVVVATLMAACILFGAAAVAKGGVLKSVQKLTLISFALLLFGGGIAVEASLGPREVEQHVAVAATLTAQNLQFDKAEIQVPADEPFALELVNRDAQPHNVSILSDTAGEKLFTFTPFVGPATRQFESGEDGVPAGVYNFQCDVHPSMNGKAVAGEPPPGGTPPPQPTGSPSPGAAAPPAPPIDLIAKNIAFDKAELSFPRGTQVTINFRNDDPGVPHNWSLYGDQTYTPPPLFAGEIFTGPGERKYAFTAPETSGTFYFKCDVHANMTGKVTVI
jgi:plastocyanin